MWRASSNAAVLCAFLPLRQSASSRCIVLARQKGVQRVRLHIEKHGHDPRQVDLVAVIVLIVLVFGAICYLCGFAADPIMTGFLVPSENAYWDEAEHDDLVAVEPNLKIVGY